MALLTKDGELAQQAPLRTTGLALLETLEALELALTMPFR